MAFWGVEVKTGKPYTHSHDQTCGRLRVSQAALGLGTSNAKSVVQCNVGKKSPVLLCSLLPDKVETCHLELEFEETEDVTFSVLGGRSVHLTGYYLGNVRRSVVGDDESESFGEDVGETDSGELDPNDEDDYDDSFIDDGDLKEFSPSPSSSDEESKGRNKKKKSDNSKSGCRRLKKKHVLSESEEEVCTSPQKAATGQVCDKVIDVDDDDDDQMPISSLGGNAKTVHRPKDSKRKKLELGDGSVDENQSEEKKGKKKKRKTSKENEAPAKTDDTPLDRANDGTEFMTNHRETETDKQTKTLSSGLIIEELKVGDQEGKVASSGKKVTVHYTGKLKEGGKIFDSSLGKSPLKFRLGKGRAVDGLDIGIEGMQVGGKRRLIIPPELGYGSEGTDRVPPNSWLIMEVELLRAR